MSVPIPLKVKATKWRQLCRHTNDGPEPATIARDRSLQLLAKGKDRLLIKENVFLDLLAMVF